VGIEQEETWPPGELTFADARREVEGLTAPAERRVLARLAAGTPRWVHSDHLTALGFVATLAAGLCYWLARDRPAWLLAVDLCLVLNWFGDSLDGTLARYRRCPRPRYGFYVDHVVDALGAFYVVGGLAAADLMSQPASAVLLVAYYLTCVHVYLCTYTLGSFRISYAAIGPTELRIVLAIANLAAWRWPRLTLASVEVRFFDLLAAFTAFGLAGVLLTAIPRTVAALRRAEPRP